MHRHGFGLALLAALSAGISVEAQMPRRTFSLADRVWVDLTTDWAERRNEDPPPPNQLVNSAPKLVFSDLLVLENRSEYGVLKIAISENPFLDIDGPSLEARMQAGSGRGLVNHLFYFFFPPPRNCLTNARKSIEAAKREEEARRAREEKDEKEKRPPRNVSIISRCELASTPLDFFADQVSSSFSLDSASRSEPVFRSFYVPPMEQMEISGTTFFIFEAQGQRYVERAELDKFNLPEELRGARAYLFWAIGAESPFPFIRDPLRKNVPLIHVAYACLSTTGTARAQFLQKLKSLRFGQ